MQEGGQKLRRQALHAFKTHCGTKSTSIAPPNSLTDSHIRFLSKAQPYHFFYDSDAQIRTIFYLITEVYRLNSF